MMETEGFEVIDLGRDVPIRDFVDKAKEVEADIICMSTLMTTTMDGMGEVIKLLKEEGIREKVTVMIGGGPISQNFADKIGADIYTTDASKAAKYAKKIVSEKVPANQVIIGLRWSLFIVITFIHLNHRRTCSGM